MPCHDYDSRDGPAAVRVTTPSGSGEVGVSRSDRPLSATRPTAVSCRFGDASCAGMHALSLAWWRRIERSCAHPALPAQRDYSKCCVGPRPSRTKFSAARRRRTHAMPGESMAIRLQAGFTQLRKLRVAGSQNEKAGRVDLYHGFLDGANQAYIAVATGPSTPSARRFLLEAFSDGYVRLSMVARHGFG